MTLGLLTQVDTSGPIATGDCTVNAHTRCVLKVSGLDSFLKNLTVDHNKINIIYI